MAKGKAVTPQSKVTANPTDVSTIDEIMKSFYESVSYTVGKQPDYKRFRSLLHQHALITPPKADKKKNIDVMDIDTFVKGSVEDIVITGMERKGLVQTEIARRMQSFGNIVHVFSTFEAHHAAGNTVPLHRGVYSIQLIREIQRWWIISVMWEIERPGMLVPKAYLI